MNEQMRVLIVGWHPSAVDYSKWPGLTHEKLQAAIDADMVKFKALGYEAELGLIESEQNAESALLGQLLEKQRDCVLIGAGVRTIPEYLPLLERLLNTIHQHAPHAKICFNSGPFDSVEAVQRSVPIPHRQ
ncbi:SGNH/GDSL hydrolase family protein [Pseudomonas zeae]|uniref:SGNH/GDSL hydrolase family protein n=1 Tax=Pseudomonas zeae TaxID=2745510 RepID=UPI0039E0477A